MLKFAAAALLVMAAFPAAAAEESPRAVSVSAGLGFAFPTDQNGHGVPGNGAGAYAEGEYVFRLAHWFTPRAYAGFVYAPPESNCGTNVAPCDVSARIVFAGGKARLMAPIPYVGPFFELGVGLSAGHLSTQSGTVVAHDSTGVFVDVPFALGIAFGDRHQYAFKFDYLFHPEQQQFTGAAALGLSFDL
jgi:hypothetical protein